LPIVRTLQRIHNPVTVVAMATEMTRPLIHTLTHMKGIV